MRNLDKQTVITIVGPERYQAATRAAQQVARYFGTADAYRAAQVPEDGGLPHEIGEIVMDSTLPSVAKMALLLDFHADLPTYGLLYVIAISWFDLEPEAHDRFWEAARDILSRENDVRAGPLEYALGVDWLEDNRTVEEAWAALVRDQASPQLLRHVLAVSGAVPAALREPLYARLIGDPSWHPAILHSLLASKEQYSETADKQRAIRILQHLAVPAQATALQGLLAYMQS